MKLEKNVSTGVSSAEKGPLARHQKESALPTKPQTGRCIPTSGANRDRTDDLRLAKAWAGYPEEHDLARIASKHGGFPDHAVTGAIPGNTANHGTHVSTGVSSLLSSLRAILRALARHHADTLIEHPQGGA